MTPNPQPTHTHDSRSATAEPTCGTCRWVDTVILPDGPSLICRRNPPQVIGLGISDSDEDLYSVQWPPVDTADWCGEHTPAPALALHNELGGNDR